MAAMTLPAAGRDAHDGFATGTRICAVGPPPQRPSGHDRRHVPQRARSRHSFSSSWTLAAAAALCLGTLSSAVRAATVAAQTRSHLRGAQQPHRIAAGRAARPVTRDLGDYYYDEEDEEWPEGCSWECYIDRYTDLKLALTSLPHGCEDLAAEALRHWSNHGSSVGRHCTCKEAPSAPALVEEEMSVEEEADDYGYDDEEEADDDDDTEMNQMTLEEVALETVANVAEEIEEAFLAGEDNDEEELVETVENLAAEAEELEGEDGDAAQIEALALVAAEEKLIADIFPPGCSWECYVANYDDLGIVQDADLALRHWINKGQAEGRDCRCNVGLDVMAEADTTVGSIADKIEEPTLNLADKIEELEEETGDEEGQEKLVETIVAIADKIEELEEEDDDAAATEALVLEAAEEELIAAVFPPGCKWECYLANNLAGTEGVEHTQDAALKHYMQMEGFFDCSCKGLAGTDEAEAIYARTTNFCDSCMYRDSGTTCLAKMWWSVGGGHHNPMEEWMEHNLQYCTKPAAQDPKTEKDDEVINALVNVEQQMLELEGKDDGGSVAEKEQLKELEEELIESTFPEGCTWECYLAKHPWVAEHIEHKQEAALEHYKFHAAKESGEWDCSCKDGQEVNINPELEDLG